MSRTATESRKLNEVASVYIAEGYEVLVEPAAGRLPRSPYPEKATFVDADEPSVGAEIRRAADEGRAIVLVAADGSTRTLFPPVGAAVKRGLRELHSTPAAAYRNHGGLALKFAHISDAGHARFREKRARAWRLSRTLVFVHICAGGPCQGRGLPSWLA
jgi:hypothetical protein